MLSILRSGLTETEYLMDLSFEPAFVMLDTQNTDGYICDSQIKTYPQCERARVLAISEIHVASLS